MVLTAEEEWDGVVPGHSGEGLSDNMVVGRGDSGGRGWAGSNVDSVAPYVLLNPPVRV
jgi:hypothetical protein